MKRVRTSGDVANRDGEWTGIILVDAMLVSGDVFTVNGESYLVQTAPPSLGVQEWFAVKCNVTVEHKRLVEGKDDDGNDTQAWTSLGSTPAWGQIVTARLRADDPGLLDQTRYIFQLPSSMGVQVLDRLVYNGRNYRVESIDDVAMSGVVRVQLGEDNR
jgi:hypothetical protein